MSFDTARSSSWSTHAEQFRLWIAASLFGVFALALADAAFADPPSRVARLGYISGAVSFSPAGEDNWVEAAVNRPLITGDRLWVDSGARAELQVGSAVFYLGAGTSVTLLNLDNRLVQLEVTQGTVNAKVRRLGPRDVVEIDTPNLANSIRRPGSYRVEVDPADDATSVIARNGQAEVYGDGASYLVNAGQGYRFYGAGLRDYDNLQIAQPDEFDRWADTRYRRSDKSASARYVSRDVIGYEDLDENGTWRRSAEYGNVWYPNRVSSDWAPYRDGHWSWVEPWGWTWVDDAPWGFAVSHYGRWAHTGGNWGWVPGPPAAQPVYAPALVAFIAGAVVGAAISNNNSGNVGWFPLGPREVYRPSYPVSRGYFTNVNTSNTVVNNTTIVNVYNQKRVTNVTYVNQRVPGAVVAVPAAAFAQSRPVGRSRVDMSRDAVAKAPATPVAAVTPVQASVHGGAPAGRRPPNEARARPVVAKERPPAATAPFAARERELAARPGRPLDAKASAAVKPAAPVPAAEVKVVTPPQKPAAAPPPKQAVAQDAPRRSPEQRGSRDGKGRPPEVQKGAPPPEAQKGSPAPETPKGAPPPDAQKGPALDGKKAPSPAEAPKGPPPSEPRKAGQPPEAQKGSPFERTDRRPPETQKGLQPPATAPQPPASVPRPPEPPKAPPPEAQKAPSPPVIVPRPLEVRVPPPETPKAAPPEVQKSAPPPTVPRPQETPKGPPPEAQKAPSPPPDVPRRRDERRAPQSPPEERKAAQPPEERRAPSPPVSAPRAPEPPKAPPPEAQKAPSPPPVVQRPPEPPKAPPQEERRPTPPPPPPVAPKPAPPPPAAPPPPPPPKPAPPPPPPPPPPPKPAPPPPPVAPKPPPAPPPAAAPAPAPKPEASKAPDKGERKKDDKKD